ncbi:MAG: twin-arginine translocase subunit TatC, partial [Pseudomonadota bacterium]|nr:twin-arginine translocase subunit TatC [Pseudomonadota bacterium]
MTSTGSKDTTMPLLDHLGELRRRLIFCFVGVIFAFFLCYAFSQNIYNFLVEPLANIGSDGRQRRMIFTGLHEAFFTQVKVAFFGAVFLMFPLIATQIWRFVAPGLYAKEKRAFLPFLLATPVLFLLGAVTVYYVVIPIAWEFFVSFEQIGGQGTLPMELEPKVNEYLSLVMGLILAFGICFELPIFLLLATKVGITNAEGLKKKRKYAI